MQTVLLQLNTALLVLAMQTVLQLTTALLVLVMQTVL